MKTYLLLSAMIAGISTPAIADEEEQHGAAQESHSVEGHAVVHHDNHIGLSAAAATTNLHSNHTNYTLGADYERRLSPRFGVGALADVVFAHHRETILAGAVVFHPGHNLRFMFAPGVLFVDGSSEHPFVARFGAGYDVHAGWSTLTPTFNVDVIDGHVSLRYGLTLGFGF